MRFSFDLWSGSSSPPKVQRLHSLQMHQNKHKGAISQRHLFLSNLLNFHLRSKFLTVLGNTYFRPKIAKRNIHNPFVLSKWIKIWLVDSSLSLQRLHLLTINHSFFINVSIVRIFPQAASQLTKWELRGAHEPQISSKLPAITTMKRNLIILIPLFV